MLMLIFRFRHLRYAFSLILPPFHFLRLMIFAVADLNADAAAAAAISCHAMPLALPDYRRAAFSLIF